MVREEQIQMCAELNVAFNEIISKYNEKSKVRVGDILQIQAVLVKLFMATHVKKKSEFFDLYKDFYDELNCDLDKFIDLIETQEE